MAHIIRKNHNISITQVAEDKFLSSSSKGVYCYLHTHLDATYHDLDLVIDKIKEHSKESLKEINSYVKELEDLGYVRIEHGSK